MSAGEGNCTAVLGGTVKRGGPAMAEGGAATSGYNWYCHGLVGVAGAKSRVSLQALRSAHPARAIQGSRDRLPTYCTITGRAMPVMCDNIATHRVLLIAKQVPKQLNTPSAIAAAQLFGSILPHGHSLTSTQSDLLRVCQHFPLKCPIFLLMDRRLSPIN